MLWQPRSTCGDTCLAAPVPRAPRAVAAARLAAVVVVTLAGTAVLALVPGRAVPAAVRRLARCILYCLGVRHIARGRRPQRPALVVANHVSWLDILVLVAHWPVRLVAKREVGGWPVVGRLARAAGTVFIDRTRPRTLPGTVREVTAALAGGATVAAFPEATTWCGRDSGRFRPALFQAAVDAGTAVVPVRLSFGLADGTPTTVAAFVGADPLLRSVRRVAATRGLVVTAQALPALHPAPGATRKRLAVVADSAVRGQSIQLNERSTALRHRA